METPVSPESESVAPDQLQDALASMLPADARASMAPCSVCGRQVQLKNMARHVRQVHGGRRGRIPDARGKCPECGADLTARYIPQHMRVVHGIIVPMRKSGRPKSNGSRPTVVRELDSQPDVSGASVSDIVETIVSIRYPDRVPTNLLAQVLELENVIRKFLEP